MDCVLRISASDLSRCDLVPYRLESGSAHFLVSEAGFDDVTTQIRDAVQFLRANRAQLMRAMGSDASGVLDFAVERRDLAVQCDVFPSDLVRGAGHLGLALEFSHYPQAEAPSAEA